MTHEAALARCDLFAGLSEDRRAAAVALLEGSRRQYARGDVLHAWGEPMPAFGLVCAGLVQVFSYDRDGAPYLLASVEPGGTFGECLSYLSVPAEVHAVAARDCEILWLRAEPLRRPADSALAAEMQQRFCRMLCLHTLQMNGRIRILSRHSLRGKIWAYLSRLAPAGSEPFTVPLDREALASYLGCDRSALCRELSRMQRDGLITYHGARFSLRAPTEGADR